MFHTYAGIDVIGQDTIYDHNWRKGGYEELTLLQGLAYNSSIAIDKAVDVPIKIKMFSCKSYSKWDWRRILLSKVPGLFML